MRAHAEPVWNGLELLLFFVNAVAGAPPPRLVHKGPVGRIHETDDPVIDGAGQFGGEISGLVLVRESGQLRGWKRRVFAASKSRTHRARIWNEHPDEAVALFASEVAGVNAINLEVLIGRERGDQAALSRLRVEFPAVIAALDLASIELTAMQRHASVRTGILQRESSSIGVTT